MLKNRTLVALAALVLVGGATVWKVTRKDPHVLTAASEHGLSIKKDDVDEIDISQADKPDIQLKKQGSEWKLVKPIADRADQKAVDAALKALTEVKLRDVIAESPESYDKVGLKASDIVKIVPKKAGKPLVTLIVGKTSNVRVNDDKRVWSTANLQRWALVKEPKLWRDRSILDLPVDQMDRIEVTYKSGKVIAKREPPPAPPQGAKDADSKKPAPPKGPDKWTLLAGADEIGGALDSNVPVELASTLSRLQADDFAPASATLASTGLDAPRATVTVTQKDGKAKTLLVGKSEAQTTYVKLAGGPRIWTIHKWESDRIPGSPAQWRDKTIVRLDPKEITKIEIVKGKDKTVLERTGDKTFKATAPADLASALDQNRVQGFLRTVEALHATKVLEDLDAKAAGLDEPRAVATLWKKDGKQIRIAFGADKDNVTPVQVSGLKDLYGLPTYLSKQLVKAPGDFKKTKGAQAKVGGM